MTVTEPARNALIGAAISPMTTCNALLEESFIMPHGKRKASSSARPVEMVSVIFQYKNTPV